MILFINASPILKMSNSEYFINLLNINNKKINYIYKDKYEDIEKIIYKANKIIFVYPTYIDIIPSKLINFIENYKGNFNYKEIYLIINCGFLEPKNNDLGIKFMKNYIKEKQGNFKGYLSIGSGEAPAPCKKKKKKKKKKKNLRGICHDFFKKLKKFRKFINLSKNIELKTNIKLFNKKLFCIICNHYFKKNLSKNKVKENI